MKLKPTLGLKCKLNLSFKMRISQTDDSCHATNLETHSLSTGVWYTDHQKNWSSRYIFFVNYSETAITEIKPSYKYCETKKVFDYTCTQNEADLKSWVEALCTKSSRCSLPTLVITVTQTTGCATHLPWYAEAEPHAYCSSQASASVTPGKENIIAYI